MNAQFWLGVVVGALFSGLFYFIGELVARLYVQLKHIHENKMRAKHPELWQWEPTKKRQ